MPRCTGCAAFTPEAPRRKPTGADGSAFEGAELLGVEAAAQLHAFAQDTVHAWARGGALPRPPDHPELMALAGAFVTLHRAGALRGCIGHIENDLSIREAAGRMAVAAARDDPRFPPLGAGELEWLTVEVTVLMPPLPTRPDEVVPGRDGVIVRRAGRLGVLLPQVAAEMGWGRVELLDGVCRKAGLAAVSWRDAGTEILTFRAQVIAERDAP
ncbi:MAG: AmmeMemoRadiSam system protein A [Gemmatimonadales bacterium]|nr:AmmeMemoRadiSam system protein A [Gemmatimonadales bacterium]